MRLRLARLTAALTVVVAFAIVAVPGAVAARAQPARVYTGPVRQARPVARRVAQGFLPFTRLDVLLMASGCTVLLLFGASLRLVPRRIQ